MPSEHREPALTVRPPADLKRDAQATLAERGLQMRAFVVACLAALINDPERFLATLRPHWPDKKPHLGGRAASKREQ
ncbi:hypothetical protein BAY61_31955 (plasmid) [Prauserella marina]|uniref:Uncharacterized protein n=2 Tax=Prauserella marina TaxID=530584 RepID=A0A222W1E3_9PSEU|nr:hypothetical protein BAY61_31955 [Prauserella marina]PWV71398.1 hypothetical protein DES30_112114 [Prauserella marina]SDD98538.1 hypothetical protein SAMN05421630_115165 [Prauserella marina]